MAETAALLVDNVLPHKPVRPWVLRIPWSLRLLLANNSQAMGMVLGTATGLVSNNLADSVGRSRAATIAGVADWQYMNAPTSQTQLPNNAGVLSSERLAFDYSLKFEAPAPDLPRQGAQRYAKSITGCTRVPRVRSCPDSHLRINRFQTGLLRYANESLRINNRDLSVVYDNLGDSHFGEWNIAKATMPCNRLH